MNLEQLLETISCKSGEMNAGGAVVQTSGKRYKVASPALEPPGENVLDRKLMSLNDHALDLISPSPMQNYYSADLSNNFILEPNNRLDLPVFLR